MRRFIAAVTALVALGAAIAGTTALAPPAPASASAERAAAGTASRDVRFTASDGVTLQTTLTGAAPLVPRPTVVEFSPYGRNSGTLAVGSAYNSLLVQIRGTGDSDGQFDALGPRTQADVAEVLRWACNQPWSDHSLALNGFSASAITIYNSLHLQLPCVKAAVLRSGTLELYRDLLVPGGISNIVPGAGVMALIGAPALAQASDRLQRNPASGLGVVGGLLDAGVSGGFLHPTLDSWWRQRGFRGDVNHLPILMIDGFFDVESRGAFQAYQALRGDGAHLLVVGGHDGAPVGTDDGVPEANAWLDHYVRGVHNGIDTQPNVQMLLSQGDRQTYLDGQYTRLDASDWPVPGTQWAALSLDPTRSGSATSLNDGTLTLGRTGPAATQAYISLPSVSTSTDPPNAAIVGAMGLNALTAQLPVLTDMQISDTLGLTYSTAPLRRDVTAAGPAALDIQLASTSPETGIWAVISDVGPDGIAHPLMAGRLNSSFPGVDASKSLHDGQGAIVEPYGRYETKQPATPGQFRRYQVEFWPIGNVFRAGHRIRLEIVGESAASLPTLPGVNLVKVGAGSGAVLRFPVLPGSDLGAALGG
ncbi:MAG TPA: CocE/NonD family hydrolase [Acidimicrobiales bacterium]|nr:CocE/NonD family hydrolase [Acidimicrobiales bacterium]